MTRQNDAPFTARCPLCGSEKLVVVLVYNEPPPGETPFPSLAGREYRRDVLCCEVCGHFISRLPFDPSALYAAEYVDATYGDRQRAIYDRIMGLPLERSDNKQRVRDLCGFVSEWRARECGQRDDPPHVLDVGSGLCVFLASMKKAGWLGTALDPDPRAAAHARDVVGVESLCGDFMTVTPPRRYDLVTFNKVLEHVPNPVQMLARSADYLLESGIVYVEVPDGEMAIREGGGREEFFIEHLWVFSAASLVLLARRAGFRVARLQRVREPSTKYTLRACLFRPEGRPEVPAERPS